ncbi:MAG: hypothetical protein JO210_17415 [Acidobacteriaceae bacterium]|nr:hypothetical protein [Acidobacteriaceae bacterium]
MRLLPDHGQAVNYVNRSPRVSYINLLTTRTIGDNDQNPSTGTIFLNVGVVSF